MTAAAILSADEREIERARHNPRMAEPVLRDADESLDLADLPGSEPVAELEKLDDGRPPMFLAAELAANPDLMKPPAPTIPRVAFRGRLTRLAGRRKTSGKSTLLTYLVAAKSRGDWIFGEASAPGTTLWLALDESHQDLIQRLVAAGADLTRIYVVLPSVTVTWLVKLAKETEADLIVIDTVSDLTAGQTFDGNKDAEVRPLLSAIRAYVRESNASCVFAHHVTKATGVGKGAGAFDDIPDHLLTLVKDDQDDTVRKVEAEGRCGVQDFAVRWTPEGFDLVTDAKPTTREQVVLAVWSHPGCSTTDVIKAAGRRREEVLMQLADCLAHGILRNDGNRSKAQWFHREHGNGSGNNSKPKANAECTA